MTDKAWKLSFHHYHWPRIYIWGFHFHYFPHLPVGTQLVLALEFGTHNWDITLTLKGKVPGLTRPKWWQCVLCVVIICTLQALLWALDIYT